MMSFEGGDDRRRERYLERRHISVLFCDLVGSTALSYRVDPEELSAILARYREACAQVIAKCGGHVASYFGDGIMAYFGWPRAHEDDAERAVHAGLALIEAVAAVSRAMEQTLSVRAGIASGLVVIGSDRRAGDGSIAGETPNLAARLQAEAAPDTVVVSPATARLAGDSFEYQSLGPRLVRGMDSPIEALRVIGPGSTESRFRARQRPDAPFVDRKREIDLLMQCWARAAGGHGQLVLLSGDAGIGKSRLLEEFCERSGAACVRRYQCLPLHTDSALAPFAQQIQRAAGLKPHDSPELKLAKIRSVLDRAEVDSDRHLPFVCHLLQLGPGAPKLPDLTPQQLRDRLVDTLWTEMRSLGRHGPVLIIVEDVQWVDPTTESLLLGARRDLANLPMAIIATGRERFPTRWDAPGCTTRLHLDRLDEGASKRLVQAVADGHVSTTVEAKIAARAEGNPLYLEELTRSVLQSEGRERNAIGAAIDDIPTALRALLNTRLDQMGEAKRLAQVGAVLGRHFALRDLRAVAEVEEKTLHDHVEELSASGLLHRHGAGSDAALVFKHALVHDAAYASLLNSEKIRLHRRTLEHLERNGGASPALLAFHAERGAVWDKAARCLIAACSLAIRASANHEALALFERALAALEPLPAAAAAPAAIDLRLHAFYPLVALGEVDRLLRVVREADGLAEQFGDKRRRAAAKSQLAAALWFAGEYRAGMQAVADAERLATELDDFVLRLSVRYSQANLSHALGMIREAAALYAAMVADLRGELEFKRFGWHGIASVLTRGHLAWSQVWLGEFSDAWQTIARAQEIVRQVPDPYSTVFAHIAQGLYHIARGELPEAIAAFEAAHRVNSEADMVLPIALAWLGAAYAQGGRADEAVRLLLGAERDGTYKSGGKYCWIHHYLALSQAHLALGEFGLARAAAGRAKEIAEPAEEVVHLAWILKTEGDIETADPSGSDDAASRCYRQAIDIAAPRGLRPLVAHCHAGLAQLFDRAGKTETAAPHRAEADRIFCELGLRDWPSRLKRIAAA